jgi:hypothetical protein
LDVITLDPATRRGVSGLLEGHIILPNGCVVGYRVDKGTIPIQQKTANEQRGTKENPFVVDVLTPTKTDAEVSQEQKERNEKLSLDKIS